MQNATPEKMTIYLERWFLVLISLSIFWTLPAYAGAWLQPKGRGQIILNSLYYTSDSRYDDYGFRQPQSTYQKYEINPYIEYGLYEELTIGANLSLQSVAQDNARGISQKTTALGDSEFFVRTPVWQNKKLFISAAPMIKIPSPSSSNDTPRVGSSYPDLALGLSLGSHFHAYGRKHFVDVGYTYRHRLGKPLDQMQLSTTIGLSITDRWSLLSQAFTTTRTSTPISPSFTQSASDDYDLLKLQISVVYRFTDRTSFQFGAFGDVAGRNVGIGRGTLFSVWRTF